jgi:hypothetical protein
MTYPVLSSKLVESGVISQQNASDYCNSSELFHFLTFPKKSLCENAPQCFADQFKKSKENFPIEDIRRFGYDKTSIGFFLKFDNFDEIQKLSTVADFDFFSPTFISPCDLPHPTTLNSESLLSVCAFYGSIECFKFIFLNGVPVLNPVCISAVKGGNLEILQICEQEHGDFSKCLPASVAYLRNDVADWIINNFKPQACHCKDSIQSLNFQALVYLCAQQNNIHETVQIFIDLLTLIISQWNLSLSYYDLHLFLMYFGNLLHLSFEFKLPIHDACLVGNYHIVEYLIAHGADANSPFSSSIP